MDHSAHVTVESAQGTTGFKFDWRLALIPAGVSMLVFWWTLSPEVGPGDAAELSLQAHRLGVAHPPGSPVHAILGYLFGLFVDDAALATNLLSAFATAVAVGLLSSVTWAFTHNKLVAIIAPLMFALNPLVWESAVSTETYCVGTGFVAAALWMTVAWYKQRNRLRATLAGLFVGLSLGVNVANALLLPGWIILVWRRSRSDRKSLLFACFGALAVGVLVLSWPWLRGHAHQPLGTQVVPDNARDLWTYLTAAEYRAIGSLPQEFYVERILQHGKIFLASLLWLGAALGAIGVWQLRKGHRRFAYGLLLMFAVNMLYFTWHPWVDYHEMVIPSYLIATVWMAIGVDALQQTKRMDLGFVSRAVLAVMVMAMLATGLRDFSSRGRGTPITEFAQKSFDLFPEKSVVISEWDTFTTLLYFQECHGWRPDIRLVERAHWQRHYKWGTVEEWRNVILENDAKSPVIVDVLDLAYAHCESMQLKEGWYAIRRCQQATEN